MDRTPLIRKIVKFVASPWWPAFASAFISPGLGQIINRSYPRGLFLMGASLGSLFYFSRTLTAQLQQILPGQPEQWHQNQESLRAAVMTLIEKNPGMYISFHLLILTIWIFSIADAYITAKNKKKPKKALQNDLVDN